MLRRNVENFVDLRSQLDIAKPTDYEFLMPHIRIRSLDESVVKKLSRELPRELSMIMQTPVDNFSVELIATQFFKDGVIIEGDPMIEVLWFERSEDVKNASAAKITELVRSHVSSEFISVVFLALPKQDYFENGQHF